MIRTKRELAKWTCRGCGLTTESHLRSRVYCSSECSFLYRATRALCRCPICKDRDLAKIDFWPTSELRAEAEQHQLAFAEAHERCRRAKIDSTGRPTECQCFQCARARGEKPQQGSTGTSNSTRKVTSEYRKNRDYILERAGWTCEICQLPIDRDALPFHDKAPAVDPIIPVRDGGWDDLDNLRAAHRWCNLRREHPGFGHDQKIFEDARTRFLEHE